MNERIATSEYGSRGIVGIGVPQANPTVEQEMFALRPAGMSIVTSRLLSSNPDVGERLLDYIKCVPDYLAQYDDLQLDVYGIACTGSSYLLGLEQEQKLTEQFSAEHGLPVVTAAKAIASTLQQLQVETIAIVSPYPDWLQHKAREYWTGAGFQVQDMLTVTLASDNIHSIYSLTSDDALRVAEDIDLANIDALLFSGTGMPALGAIHKLTQDNGTHIMSSNLCLLSRLAEMVSASGPGLLRIPAGFDSRTL